MPWLTDNDDTTCNYEKGRSITVRLKTPHPLTWVRIVVKAAAYLRHFRLSYEIDGSESSVPCINPRSARVDDVTLDISCPTLAVVSHVTLSSWDVLRLCSLYISGGRNMALNQATRESSTYGMGTHWGSYRAVDGTPRYSSMIAFSQRTCSHTVPNRPGLAWWRVTFSNDVEINRFVIYNRRDCCEVRLVNFTLQALASSNSNVTYSYTDSGGPAQLVYTVVPAPVIGFPVKCVQFDVSKNTHSENIMTLCEVYVFGEGVCPAGKFGRQCERDCNCADQTDACFVSTGGCPSGCAAGYTGEDCYTQCNRGSYGKDCSKACSVHCAGDANPCNHVNGTCEQGCENGYLTPLCTPTCPRDRYGAGCNETCSEHCAGQLNICDHRDGTCLFGCEEGYGPPKCDEGESEQSSGSEQSADIITGVVVAAVAVVGAAVVLMIFFWRRRSVPKRHGESLWSNEEIILPQVPVNGTVHHTQVYGDLNQPSNIYETDEDKYDRPLSLAVGDGAYKNSLSINDTSVPPDQPDRRKKDADAWQANNYLNTSLKNMNQASNVVQSMESGHDERPANTGESCGQDGNSDNVYESVSDHYKRPKKLIGNSGPYESPLPLRRNFVSLDNCNGQNIRAAVGEAPDERKGDARRTYKRDNTRAKTDIMRYRGRMLSLSSPSAK
ncbi:multiple epidermal growth factor-like domains 10 [Plakobranchus ocellatus]|uniref:Multiple epidermal growth factor-like domains 10 n=1 Tax=Plakobranchus ocellatus TaxID=259542 RepID=A0AAV4D543_9GAST|nr:multiple epidermal growth factor-like domains 10 [Plakobranchus ocellatus]